MNPSLPKTVNVSTPPKPIQECLDTLLDSILETPEIRRAVCILSETGIPNAPKLNGEAILFCGIQRYLMHDEVAERNRLGGSSACLGLTRVQKQFCEACELAVLTYQKELIRVEMVAMALSISQIPRAGKIFRSKKALFAYLGYPYPKKRADYPPAFEEFCIVESVPGSRKVMAYWDSPFVEVVADAFRGMRAKADSEELKKVVRRTDRWLASVVPSWD